MAERGINGQIEVPTARVSGPHWAMAKLRILEIIFFFKFLCGTVFKVSVEFVTVLLLFCFGFGLCGIWDLSSPTRNQTCTPCTGS